MKVALEAKVQQPVLAWDLSVPGDAQLSPVQ